MWRNIGNSLIGLSPDFALVNPGKSAVKNSSAATRLREFKLPGEKHQQVVLKTYGHTIDVVALVLLNA